MTSRKKVASSAADTPNPDVPNSAADDTARRAKASVHEAIGTLLGDDAAQKQGRLDKHAAAPAKPPKR